MDIEAQALREAYAVAPADTVVLDTLEVSTEGQPSIYLTNNYVGFSAALETGSTVAFQAIPFKLKQPDKSNTELPTMSIVIANPNQLVSNYLRAANVAKTPVKVKYRPFLATSEGTVITCQLPVPMTFHIGPVKLALEQVEVQCLFPNIANKRFPNESYTVRLFPGLRGWTN